MAARGRLEGGSRGVVTLHLWPSHPGRPSHPSCCGQGAEEKRRFLFLFSDVLLIAKARGRGEGLYSLKTHVRLQDAWVNPMPMLGREVRLPAWYRPHTLSTAAPSVCHGCAVLASHAFTGGGRRMRRE